MPIYRNGNSYSDTGGEDMTDAIKRLLPRRRGKGRLPDPPTREALPSRQVVSHPSGGSINGAGIRWPLTEVSRITTTVRVYDPHDATRYVDFEDITTLTVQDADGRSGQIILSTP